MTLSLAQRRHRSDPLTVCPVARARRAGSGTESLVSEPQVQEALALAEQYAARAQRQEQLVDDRLFVEVSAALMACVGPMGRVMVEDALDELPAPARLSALLRTIAQELEDTQRQTFARQLRAREIV